jgi:HK97 gp10 family phage protein
MADGISMTMTGLPELLGKMKALQTRKPKEVADAVLASANDAMDFAAPLCRVGSRKYTENGRDHPGYMLSRDQVRVLNQYAAEFYNDCDYAVFNELGTRYMSAQPWMAPGFEYGRARLLERLGVIANTL